MHNLNHILIGARDRFTPKVCDSNIKASDPIKLITFAEDGLWKIRQAGSEITCVCAATGHIGAMQKREHTLAY